MVEETKKADELYKLGSWEWGSIGIGPQAFETTSEHDCILNIDHEISTSDYNQLETTTYHNIETHTNYQQRLDSELLNAIEDRRNCDVERLLNINANPNATCHPGHLPACHLAVILDNIEALNLLLRYGAEIHSRDTLGRTPLHIAAWKGNLQIIAILLKFPKELQDCIANPLSADIMRGIKRDASDTENQVLLSMKCDPEERTIPENWQNNVDICKIDNQVPPPLLPGWTALHVASSRAHASCVGLLIAAGADAFAHDNCARTPLDVAGSAYYNGQHINVNKFIEVVTLFLEVGVKVNNSNSIPRFSTPLHIAVELKDLAVMDSMRSLLKTGASTAVLNQHGYSPMHLCALYRQKDQLQLLTHHGDIDEIDLNGYTVLHTAVLEEWFDGVKLALRAGASIYTKASNGQTPISTAASLGNADMLDCLLSTINTKVITDRYYFIDAMLISIHYNNLDCVKVLLKHITSISKITSENNSFSHSAARNGVLEIIKLLLDHDNVDISKIINLPDKFGFTPLFYAVFNNSPHLVKALLMKNSSAHIKSSCENFTSVLHSAAKENFVEVAKVLIAHDCQLVYEVDWRGKQPLHEAAHCGNRDIIKLLLLNRADLSKPIEHEKNKTTAIEMIVKNLSKPTEFMESIFDDFITSYDDNGTVKVDYRILTPNANDTRQMKVVKALVDTGNRYGQRSLLVHPLVESFLYLKWKGLVPFFYIMLALYGCFVLSFNIYIVSVYHAIDKMGEKLPRYLNPDVWRYFVFFTVFIIIVQELLHAKLKTRKYFRRLETWVTVTAIVPATFLPFMVTQDQKSLESQEWVRLVATIAVLMSWLELMFLLSRLPNWGYYVLMFGKVASKVVKIILTFAFLIIGFSLCFMIQFRSKKSFASPVAALVKTVVMLVSEFDYEDTIDKAEAKQMAASITTLRLIFVVFLVLAAIVLMNLMVGVAVNDINDLQKIGNIRRLEKQVEFLTSLEQNVFYRHMQKLPSVFGKYLNIRRMLNNSIILKQDDVNDLGLPSYLKYALFEKAQSKKLEMENKKKHQSFRLKIDELHDVIVNKDIKVHDHTERANTHDMCKDDEDMNAGRILHKINVMMENVMAEMEILKNLLTKVNSKSPNNTKYNSNV